MSGLTPCDSSNQLSEMFNTNSSIYDRLLQFYQKHNPSNIPRIGEYLKKYEGREDELLAILSAKYGPPVSDVPPAPSGVEHYSGKRTEYPTVVSPEEGRLNYATPYWGRSNAISDMDLLQLLCTRHTGNCELQKCFLGTCDQHPEEAWNGMTYICTSNIGIAPPETLFLGHFWSGSLSSEKIVYFDRIKCRRLTLYCTDKCQAANHERWRLNIYSVLSKETVFLIRVLWDPFIVPIPLPFSSHSRDFYSSERIPTRCSSQSSEEILQPQKPQLDSIAVFCQKLVNDLEEKIAIRLDVFESRISALEGMNRGDLRR